MTDAEDREESADLRRIGREALGIGDLDSNLRELVGEVKGLRSDIGRHPHLDEVKSYVDGVMAEVKRLDRRTVRRSRKSVFFIALAIVGVFQLHDQHIDRCGAGASLKTPSRHETVTKVAEKDPAYHFACDAATPLHTHDGDPYPSAGNLAGLLFYAAATVGGVVWVRRARPV